METASNRPPNKPIPTGIRSTIFSLLLAAAALANTSPQDSTLIQGINGFGFEMLSRFANRDTTGNILLSPLGLSSALTLVANGAKGNTAAEIRGMLGQTAIDPATVTGFHAKALSALVDSSSGVYCRFSNSIWWKQSLPVEKTYLDANTRPFRAHMQAIDLPGPRGMEIVNGWVSKETRNRIPKLLGTPLASDASMALAQAMFFRGYWAGGLWSVTDGVGFKGQDGTVSECRMLLLQPFGEHSRRFARLDSLRILELPYGDSLYSMVLVTPDSGRRSQDLVAGLTPDIWDVWLDFLRPHTGVVASFPAFSITTDGSLDSTLAELGMQSVFDRAGADFSPMSRDRALSLSLVTHSTAIEVDVERNKNIKRIQGRHRAMWSGKVTRVSESFRADRPFLFAVRERRSGLIVLLGLVRDPGRKG